jgi:type II secretory pathway pseudopilin PulG
MRDPPTPAFRQRRGITLLETLVVISVVSLILALALPSLRAAKAAGRTARIIATLQQLHHATTLYTHDYKDLFPYLGYPGEPWRGLTLTGTPDTPSYFSQSRYYANLLVTAYYADRAGIDTPGDFGAASRASPSFFTPYCMTQGAFAAPPYWVGDAPPDSLTHYRPVATSECLFPASKALLMHWTSGNFINTDDPEMISVALVDGSASRRRITPELAANTVNRPYGSAPVPTLATIHGIAGRDFD